MKSKKTPGPQIKERQGDGERWEGMRKGGRERFSEGGGGGEKPGCRISAPGSAACYFSCAEALASSPCSHAIVTPSVWWHGTWAAFTLQLKVSQFFPPHLTKITFFLYSVTAKKSRLKSQLFFFHLFQFAPHGPVAQTRILTLRRLHETFIWMLKKSCGDYVILTSSIWWSSQVLAPLQAWLSQR